MYEDDEFIDDYHDYFDNLSAQDQLDELNQLSKYYFLTNAADHLYELNDYIQESIGKYTKNEKQLFESIVKIWENRSFINNNDLDNLKFFEDKGA